jgi:translation initiation factor 2 beta subunit (eIF-2beta)/eIF-5
VTIIFSLTGLNIIGSFAQSIEIAKNESIIDENILDSNSYNEVNQSKQSLQIKKLGENFNKSQEFTNGREELTKQVEETKKLSTNQFLAVNEISIDSDTNLTIKQKKIQKQIQRIIANYVSNTYGKSFSIYNLNTAQQQELEKFVSTNKKIIKLHELMSVSSVVATGSVIANAASWESCEWETSFPDWVAYKYKTYEGAKANWVGRLANTEDERSGSSPCDFSFYLNGYRANTVDGWTNATVCAVNWSGGISAKRYGYSNQKMIIGWGRMTACGVFSFNTTYLRDKIQFYN